MSLNLSEGIRVEIIEHIDRTKKAIMITSRPHKHPYLDSRPPTQTQSTLEV